MCTWLRPYLFCSLYVSDTLLINLYLVTSYLVDTLQVSDI